MAKRDFPPSHPGEILFEEFPEPMGITQCRVAKDLGVPQRCISADARPDRAKSTYKASYFRLDPRDFSTGYFSALRVIFARAADSRSTPSLSASRTR